MSDAPSHSLTSSSADKHTPGPWVYKKHGSRRRIIDAVQELTVAYVPIDLGNDGIADARLIAAAPDLLEALQWVMGAHGEQLHDAFDAAHKAIAKATGSPSGELVGATPKNPLNPTTEEG